MLLYHIFPLIQDHIQHEYHISILAITGCANLLGKPKTNYFSDGTEASRRNKVISQQEINDFTVNNAIFIRNRTRDVGSNDDTLEEIVRESE